MNLNVILEIIQKNRILFIILYVLIVIAAILIIWWPKSGKVSELARYDKIDMEQIYQSNAQKYINNLTAKFRLFGQQSIENLLDANLTYHYEKTRNQVIGDLETDGYFDSNMYMTCSDIFEVGTDVIFVTKLHSGNNYRSLNIIETSPNEYKLTLDNSYKYIQKNEMFSANGIDLVIETVYQDMDYIEYEIQLRNSSQSDVAISLDRANDVLLVMEDGTSYGLTNVESEVEDFYLKPGSTFNRKLIFNVPVSAQSNISSIKFSSAGMNGKAINLQYNIVEGGE